MFTLYKITFIRSLISRISLLALGVSFTQMIGAQVVGNQDLNGYYRGDNGGHYYVRTIGYKVLWFGEDQKGDWAHVFQGIMNKERTEFEGQHYDVAKGRAFASSLHRFSINSSATSFTRLSGDGSLKIATRSNLPSSGLPGDRCVGRQESTMTNISGCWDGNDGGKYYVFQGTNTGNGEIVVWFGEQSNTNGKPGFSNIASGIRSGNTITLDWVDIPKSTANEQGTLRLNVDNAGTITRMSETGRFRGSRWTRGAENAQSIDEQNQIARLIPKIIKEIKIPKKKDQDQERQERDRLERERQERERLDRPERERQDRLERERQQEHLENATKPKTPIKPGTLPVPTQLGPCPSTKGSDPAIVDVSIRELGPNRTRRRPGSGFINPEVTVIIRNMGFERFTYPDMEVQVFHLNRIIETFPLTNLASCSVFKLIIRPGRLDVGSSGIIDIRIHDPAVHIVGDPPPYDENQDNNFVSFWTGDK